MPHHPPTLLVNNETITNQKLVISNQYLMSPPPTKKVPKSESFYCAPLHTAHPLHGFWPFCTKGNGPHHPYLLSPLCELTFFAPTSTVYCVPTAYPTLWDWPFCTKGNGPHHPYLLSPLCELTILHQDLLRTAYLLCTAHLLHTPVHGFDLFALTSLTFLHLQSVPITRQCYS